jgi:hypothetical protein
VSIKEPRGDVGQESMEREPSSAVDAAGLERDEDKTRTPVRTPASLGPFLRRTHLHARMPMLPFLAHITSQAGPLTKPHDKASY